MKARVYGWALLVMVAAGVLVWKERGVAAHAAAASSDAARVAHETLNGFLPTVESRIAAPTSVPAGMAWIPGGEFSMGMADPRGILPEWMIPKSGCIPTSPGLGIGSCCLRGKGLPMAGHPARKRWPSRLPDVP